MYIRKTADEWYIVADYGQGDEELSAYEKRKEATVDLKLYRSNEPGQKFSLKKRRIKKERQLT